MINEIIQNIKEEAINTGKNLTLDMNSYKKYLTDKIKIKLSKLDSEIIINDFDELSKKIALNNLEFFDLEMRDDMSVSELIRSFKLTLIASYILKETAKSFLGFNNIIIN